MASSSPESQGPQEKASENLAALNVNGDEEFEFEGRFEEFKSLGIFQEELSPNRSDGIEAPYPYISFEGSILDHFDGTLQELPELFPEESEEISDEDSSVEYDDDNDNNTDVQRQKDLERNVKHIGKSVRTFCETIVVGFMMSVTEEICLTGTIDHKRFEETPNAKKIIEKLEVHKALWETKRTDNAIRLREVRELLTAIKKGSYQDILKAYYRAQHIHILNDDEPTQIPVYIDQTDLQKDWIPHVNSAIRSINEATPGINLYTTTERDASMIIIGVDNKNKMKSAYTRYGGISGDKKPFIHLGSEWKSDRMEGTSIHELMHALNFHHEMQRYDASLYVSVNMGNRNYKEMPIELGSLTRYDPFSVMNYSENKNMKRVSGDPIWELKETPGRCQKLSELNKVALNMLFKPCRSKKYDPNFNNETKMLYCGRKVMIDHNQVSKATTDYYCGPNNWANCPACRVIIRIQDKDDFKPIPKLEKCLGMDKWQGLSGLFYCGKEDSALKNDITHSKKSATCGPDTGIPCSECGQMLYYRYSIKQAYKICEPKK